jgi:hypothetical protein
MPATNDTTASLPQIEVARVKSSPAAAPTTVCGWEIERTQRGDRFWAVHEPERTCGPRETGYNLWPAGCELIVLAKTIRVGL